MHQQKIHNSDGFGIQRDEVEVRHTETSRRRDLVSKQHVGLVPESRLVFTNSICRHLM